MGGARVPDRRIVEALHEWRGNVQAAAGAIGLTRKNLYERINMLGLDLAAVRAGNGRDAMPTSQELPIRAAPKRRLLVRLLPAHEDRLREARLDFAARFRMETSESIILETFFEECFESWLKAKLAPEKPVSKMKAGPR